MMLCGRFCRKLMVIVNMISPTCEPIFNTDGSFPTVNTLEIFESEKYTDRLVEGLPFIHSCLDHVLWCSSIYNTVRSWLPYYTSSQKKILKKCQLLQVKAAAYYLYHINASVQLLMPLILCYSWHSAVINLGGYKWFLFFFLA